MPMQGHVFSHGDAQVFCAFLCRNCHCFLLGYIGCMDTATVSQYNICVGVCGSVSPNAHSVSSGTWIHMHPHLHRFHIEKLLYRCGLCVPINFNGTFCKRMHGKPMHSCVENMALPYKVLYTLCDGGLTDHLVE